MSDGVHPSELLSLRIYIDLVNANQDLLGKYSDIPALEQAITDAPNPHEVFPKK
jgi:hypothetical protein